MEATSSELLGLVARFGAEPESEHLHARFRELLGKLHASDAPEEDKLTEKDRLVIDITDELAKLIIAKLRAAEITRFEAGLLLLVVAALDAIEHVLWELKGHKADEPLPEPRPRPTPPPPTPPTPDPKT